MSKQKILIALVIIAILAFAIWLFFENFEQKEIEVATDWQGEAVTNPLYAARLFLKQMGIPAQRIEHPLSLDKLPPTSTTIILATERTTLSEQRIQNLLDWVARGGHLITAATPYGIENIEDEDDNSFLPQGSGSTQQAVQDHLQRLLGIYSDERLYYYDTPIIADDTDTTTEENTTNSSEQVQAYEGAITFEPEDETFDIEDTDAYSVEYKDSPDWQLSFDNVGNFSIRMHSFHPLLNYSEQSHDVQIFSDNGSLFGLQHRHEKGYVTLLGDFELFDNYDIDEEDNAEFFWYLLHPPEHVPESVWLLHNNEMPSLLVWLWQKAPLFLISLGLLLVASLVAAGQRFGPLIPVPVRNRRSLVEHIRASGYFFWQHKQQTFLLDSMRQAVHQQISHLHPGWRNLNHDEQRLWLEKQTQLPTEYINALLNDPLAIQAQDFRRLIQQLETLKSKL